MPAALIDLSQGATNPAAGQALLGVVGVVVNVANAVNTGVSSWQIDLVYVPPGSALATGVLASADVSALPAAAFTPDVTGSYRIVLKAWAVANRVGDPSDTDIRVMAVPETGAVGFVRPPPQIWPQPLPSTASGATGNKPNEMNFGGQENGWSGSGSDGLLDHMIKAFSALLRTGVQHPVLYGPGGEDAGTTGACINAGKFWNQSPGSSDVDIGKCWWKAVVAPLGSGYLITDSPAGDHAMLTGFAAWGDGTTPYLSVTGNVTSSLIAKVDTGSQPCDRIGIGEWGDFVQAVDQVLNLTVTYWNGICIGAQDYTGVRFARSTETGNGVLFILGSDHNNLEAKLAAATGYDANQSLINENVPLAAYFPSFGLDEVVGAKAADVALDCTVGAGYVVPDRNVNPVPKSGADFRGFPLHHGKLDWPADPRISNFQDYIRRAYWVSDATCPRHTDYPRVADPRAYVSPAQTAPSDQAYKIFDDFSGRVQGFREESNPSLGSTKSGSLGILSWATTQGGRWGNVHGYATYHGDIGYPFLDAAGLALVELGSANGGVQIRVPLGGHAGRLGLSVISGAGVVFRASSVLNYESILITALNMAWYRKVTAGVLVSSAQFAIPNNHTGIRVTFSGSTITVYSTASGDATPNAAWGSSVATFTEASNGLTKVGLIAHSSLARIASFGAW